MPRETKTSFNLAQSLTPAARTASANGTGVDLATFLGNAVVVTAGTITDGTHTPKLQESSDNSTFTDVAAGDQVGTLAAITSNSVQRVSYIGQLRYIRVVATVAGATTGGVYSAAVLQDAPRSQPQ